MKPSQTNAQNDSLEHFASLQYPAGRNDVDEEEAGKARKRLSLTAILRPFEIHGTAFLSRLWQAIVAVVKRVAQVFGVKAEIGNSLPGEPGSAAVDFVAEGNSPADHELVESAARSSAHELATKAREIASFKPSQKLLQGDGRQAYAAFHLDDAGKRLLSIRQVHEAKQAQLRQAAVLVAAQTGASVESVMHLLVNCAEEDGRLNGLIPPEARALGKEFAQLDAAVKDLELGYCVIAVDALSTARVFEDRAFESLVQQKVEIHASSEMKSLICEELESVVVHKCASQDVHLQTEKKVETESVPAKKALSRAQRYPATDLESAEPVDEGQAADDADEVRAVVRDRFVPG